MRLSIPLVASSLLLAGAIAACLLIERSRYVPGDRRYLQAAMWLGAAGVLILVWLPAIPPARSGRKLLRLDGQVDVRCPNCEYLLVGLRDLRCPECGMQFTVDELFRAQQFEQSAAASKTT